VRASLVVRAGALGDLVLTLPLIERLAADGPVDVVCAPRFACLLPDGASRVDDAWIWAGRAPPRPYTTAVAFSPTAAAALRACGLADVRERTPRPRPGVHAVCHALAALDPSAEAGPPPAPRIPARPDPSVRAAPFVIAPGSGGTEKRWPIARWREVAAALAPVVWVRGPVEEEEGDWPDDAVRPDVAGLCALAAAAGAWIGPDAGPTHLAAAVGCPTVAVFGPTDPACWAPVGARVTPWDTSPAALAAVARAIRRVG
jgi:ADP-heptose:LPS heptosyltransferase